MKDLLTIDSDFLEADRALLYEVAYEYEIGNTSPCDQHCWIASVEAAFSVVCHVHCRELFDLSPEDEFVDLGKKVVPIDTQGSICNTGIVVVRISGSVCHVTCW